jgi:hypothetical protein
MGEFNLLTIAYELKYPFINELKEKLTAEELRKWIDFFMIQYSENKQDALDNYFLDGVDDLGKQFMKAVRTINGRQ